MTAYYNEYDPKAAAWLRELIKAGHIADGIVDERSIVDVSPDDLRGFTQCHFFAGIGGWSYALRLAGWPDDKPVWTGSCPCQPFSTAGKNRGTADERHLWPVWFNLIKERRPDVIFGEQVEAAIGRGWLDLVCSDLERENYRVGAVGLPACGVGAPHIRQRLCFVADADDQRSQRRLRVPECADQFAVRARGLEDGLADANGERHDRQHALLRQGQKHLPEAPRGSETSGVVVSETAERGQLRNAKECRAPAQTGRSSDSDRLPDASDGFWRNPDWLWCRDEKWRPVEPGLEPLVDGLPERVGLLRGYGNAIVPQVAAKMIKAYVETINDN